MFEEGENKEVKTSGKIIIEQFIGSDTLARFSLAEKIGENIRTPLNLVIAIDTSGSMDIALSKLVEGQKLTRYDMTIYMVKNILEMLNEHDTISILTFSDYAKFILHSVYLTDENKKKVLSQLENVSPQGQTNLWDAIKTSYSYLFKNNSLVNRVNFINNHIIIITDGEPNISPINGHRINRETFHVALKDFLYTCPVKACLHTIGICPDSLNDEILGELSKVGSGMYGFVSDPVILSCCAINIMSMIFNMCFTNLTLQYGDKIYTLPWILQDGYTYLNLGKNNESEIKLLSNQNRLLPTSVSKVSDKKIFDPYLISQIVSQKLLSIRLADDLQEKISEIEALLKVSYLDYNCPQYINELISDINIFKRIDNDSIKLWGRYCAYSLAQSLSGGYITNPYETSVKYLQGERLKFWNQFIEDVIRNIGFPMTKKLIGKVEIEKDNNYTFSSYSLASCDNNDGCIVGSSIVEMENGKEKRVKDIVRGDLVLTDKGIRKIERILVDKVKKFIHLPQGLGITPHHPILYKGKWIFPKDHPEGITVCKKTSIPVYSFLLEKSDSTAMIINGVQTVHFAHNNSDPVLNHDFYGTEKVRQNLEKLKCDTKGKIYIKGAKRDEKGLVIEYF